MFTVIDTFTLIVTYQNCNMLKFYFCITIGCAVRDRSPIGHIRLPLRTESFMVNKVVTYDFSLVFGLFLMPSM